VLLGTVPHANVPWAFGPLRYVLVSPAYHRLHHAQDDPRGVNLGTVFVWWDMLARLAVFPEPGAIPVATGLQGRPIPVEQSVEAEGWFSLLAVLGRQLVEPFRPVERATMPATVSPTASASPSASVSPSAAAAPSVTTYSAPSLAFARSVQ
jgi:hypothetical protein